LSVGCMTRVSCLDLRNRTFVLGGQGNHRGLPLPGIVVLRGPGNRRGLPLPGIVVLRGQGNHRGLPLPGNVALSLGEASPCQPLAAIQGNEVARAGHLTGIYPRYVAITYSSARGDHGGVPSATP
jgi:hypothetical protein